MSFVASTAGTVLMVYLVLGTGVPLVYTAGCNPAGCDAPDKVACCNGDVNGNKIIEIGDAISLLQYLFVNGPPPVDIAYADTCALTADECARLRALIDEFEFGRTIAGLWAVCEPGERCFPTTLAMVTLDGGYVDVDLNDFNDAAAESRYHTATPGRWVRVQDEERQVRLTAMEYVFRDNGSLWGFGLQTITLEFSPDFTTATGTYCEEHYHEGQDPDQDQPFQIVGPAPIFVRRISDGTCQ
jgi:hypothetical protein